MQVRFKKIHRTIDPTTGVHYLDAVDEYGRHWMAEMTHREEPWLTYTRTWQLAPQQMYE